MPGKITIEFTGAREMEALLKQLGPKVAAKVGDKSLRAAAKPIVAEAKRLVPVDTGQLRKSITAVTSRKGRRRDERLLLIGFRPPASRRAHLVEFGTSKMAAQPFIRPALDAKANDALEEMARVLREGIEAETRKTKT